ncbi:hypothetical protein [Paenibacillus thermotolerans]|uniref:hypothetical protein n=1 Tax=Paenibacillus thermotolerans TaxID=3027807 RepID=UPI002367754F|nr:MULTISPECIES: hypothetical protein [unclassified Paenibacillus]
MNRVTEGWLRRFIHAYKNASFMDKMTAVRQETNPYYLLEWLIMSEEESSEFWLGWEGERTAGVEKGSLTGIADFVQYDLGYELIFGVPLDHARLTLLRTASNDLAQFYGKERWEAGVERLQSEIKYNLERHGAYKKALQAELAKLDKECKEEKRGIEEQWGEESFEEDLKAELKSVELRYERRKKEAPSKLLRGAFLKDRMLQYIVHRGIPRPYERTAAICDSLLLPPGAVAADQWMAWAESGDVSGIGGWLSANRGEAQLFSGWLASFISKSEMTRSAIDPAGRQRFALKLAADVHDREPELAQSVISAVFQASGMEEALFEQAKDSHSGLFSLLIRSALPAPERRKLLREGVLLTHWDTFAALFAQAAPETEFDRLAWVFCLDPESLQQRLLRSQTGEAAVTPEDIIRKLCRLFAEGIRRGVDQELIVSFYAYLAKHDKEAFYSFVHGTKALPEALPMFEVPPQTLSPLFRGDGIRQASARKHLLQLFYEWLEQGSFKLTEQSERQLTQLAGVLASDKRAAVNGWLQRHENDWRKFRGGEGDFPFTRLLKFRWLGTKEDPKEQHAAVEEWLKRSGDWVQFETDTPLSDKGMQYRIVRPGAVDAESGDLLARVLVRAEWADQKQVRSLLDDLKNL